MHAHRILDFFFSFLCVKYKHCLNLSLNLSLTINSCMLVDFNMTAKLVNCLAKFKKLNVKFLSIPLGINLLQ